MIKEKLSKVACKKCHGEHIKVEFVSIFTKDIRSVTKGKVKYALEKSKSVFKPTTIVCLTCKHREPIPEHFQEAFELAPHNPGPKRFTYNEY